MPDRFPPIVPSFPHMIHGGDYNPDQWLATPDVIDEDFRLMKRAGINSLSVGIFGWMALEPEEGRFTFDWLDRIMNRVADAGGTVMLATPSGSKPPWMSAKYPEIRRVNRQGLREPHGHRHNHCYSSPVYREKTAIINGKLAERYKDHPALGLWHISNEYGGECFCDLCLGNWYRWLEERYGSLDKLNAAWWAGFWAHSFTDWSQIDPRDTSVDGMMVDWRRFVTDMTVDFYKHEVAAVRKHSPSIPVAINMMGFFSGLDYWRFADVVDVITDDVYPHYSDQDDLWRIAVNVSMRHDMHRAMKAGKPFLLMESSPSSTNWGPLPNPRLKRPGVHRLEMLQAIAHGSDSCQYFQFRKSRGACEKFHGAVVDHVGHENTRVFNEVAEVGRILAKLDDVVGTTTQAQAAVIYDWDASWAIDASALAGEKRYLRTAEAYYAALWKKSIATDVIESTRPFDGYKLIIAPMLYMLKPGVAARLREFVRNGGHVIATYLTGIVSETNLCFLGGWPGGAGDDNLMELFGIWSEELDYVPAGKSQTVVMAEGNTLGVSGSFAVQEYCEIIHARGAEVVATYGEDFYTGSPALTTNRFGQGWAWFMAARTQEPAIDAVVQAVAERAGVKPVLDTPLPPHVIATERRGGGKRFVFLLNFTGSAQAVPLPAGFTDALSGETIVASLQLPGYGSCVLKFEI